MSSYEYDVVRNAILNKQQVIASYQGHVREMCPMLSAPRTAESKHCFTNLVEAVEAAQLFRVQLAIGAVFQSTDLLL